VRSGVLLTLVTLVPLWCGCGTTRLEQRDSPAKPFDVVIVPGCPSEDDGSLSRCQMSRALWAARLWDLGWARHFITSGSAVYSPYVEAEALAAALAALGVPADKIYLEWNALHTDENMFYSLQIAHAQGFRSIAVASDGAAWGCRMLLDWGQDCRAFTIDRDWVRKRHQQIMGVLEKVRAPRSNQFVTLREREREIAARTGRHRPPSYMLYLGLGMMRLNGERWVPPGVPDRPPLVTWAQRSQQL
jgi:hypothetical protein